MVTSPRQDHHGRDAADASTVAPRTLAYRRGHSRMRQEPSDDEEMYAYDTVMLPEDQTDEGKRFYVFKLFVRKLLKRFTYVVVYKS